MFFLDEVSVRSFVIAIHAVFVLLAGVGGWTPIHAQDSSVITINGTSEGRTFDGIGGLSGGGGTSRLLWDYPSRQRDEILDFLFKPNVGASLQILKVEIGSDANSTNGAEASHMRARSDSNFNRGYEWWLMEQAKARNPQIKLYGLEWGAPGWFSGGFWSQDNIAYLLSWIRHAQSEHHLHIDAIGGWNESGYNKNWFVNLKRALRNNDLTTQVVAADNRFELTPDLINDSTFRSSVDIMGVHYPCGWITPEQQCTDNTYTLAAEGLGMPIWASESGSQNYEGGAIPLARALNRDYIDSRITAYINWSVVAAWYATLPYYGDGLILADQPWSGAYQVGKSVWVMAHTSQFVHPGWRYIDSACGYIGGNRINGSYVTLKSPDSMNYSIIIETVDASAPRTLMVTVSGGLRTDSVHIWSTKLFSPDPSDSFVDRGVLLPAGGKFECTAEPGCVYSITTTTGQSKGLAKSLPASMMKLPFSEDFEADTLGQIPKYFDAIQGAFEVDSSGSGRGGKCLRQEITLAPIGWPGGSPTAPLVVVGDPEWSNYVVSTDVLLEQAGYVEVIGRLGAQAQSSPGASQGYHLRLTNGGRWSLFKEDFSGTDTQLGSGTTWFPLKSWHTLTLWCRADTVKAYIDKTLMAEVRDGTYGFGQVGLLVSKWQNAKFDNFLVDSTGSGGALTRTVDDAVQGSGAYAFNYSGAGWQHCTGCGANLYDDTNSWDATPNDFVTVRFSGTQINFYGVKDPGHGIGAVSVDGQGESMVDFYAPARVGNQLLWSGPILASGDHLFKLRVTGTKNASSSNAWVVPDRVDILFQPATTVNEDEGIPNGFKLNQNYPNPFNPSTVISYQLPVSGMVIVRVYDLLGNVVATLVDGRKSAGRHSVSFDAHALSSGAYFYSMDSGTCHITRKLLVIK